MMAKVEQLIDSTLTTSTNMKLQQNPSIAVADGTDAMKAWNVKPARAD